MNKIILVSCFFIFLLLSIEAEQWPFDVESVEYLYPHYDHIMHDTTTIIDSTVYISSQGVVYASADAKVIMSTLHKTENTDIHQSNLILETKNGLHISYYNITPIVTIGTIVRQSDIVGTVEKLWHIKIFDTRTDSWVDPFTVFPEPTTAVEIKLHDLLFTQTEYSEEAVSISNRAIHSGNNTVDISLSVLEKKSNQYMIPQFIRLQLQDTVVTISRKQIVQILDIDTLNNEHRIRFSLSDVYVIQGYYIIEIYVYYSDTFFRNFRFAIHASDKKKISKK